MIEIGKELNENTCCMCLSEEESTFNSSSTFRSHPIREMVDFCIGVQVCMAIIRAFIQKQYERI